MHLRAEDKRGFKSILGCNLSNLRLRFANDDAIQNEKCGKSKSNGGKRNDKYNSILFFKRFERFRRKKRPYAIKKMGNKGLYGGKF
jgi:hypothetical protein